MEQINENHEDEKNVTISEIIKEIEEDITVIASKTGQAYIKYVSESNGILTTNFLEYEIDTNDEKNFHFFCEKMLLYKIVTSREEVQQCLRKYPKKCPLMI